jgi:hypothetical protein
MYKYKQSLIDHTQTQTQAQKSYVNPHDLPPLSVIEDELLLECERARLPQLSDVAARRIVYLTDVVSATKKVCANNSNPKRVPS